MTRWVVGVIGHVDHGKTALVRSLTGMDTDRLPEEKERGISIALGFAHLRLNGDTIVDLIDMPGHERFVRTMIAGATGIDAVLLVVAANEGIKPQTLEHIDIAGLLGIQRAIVVVTKADLASAESAARIATQAIDHLTAAGIQALAPVTTSVAENCGLDEARQRLMDLSGTTQAQPDQGQAFLPIDRAFAVTGHGPVVTGTLRGAPISTGDVLDLFPLQRPVRIRGMQVNGAPVSSASPGQRVALNLRDVETQELHRGMTLASPGSLTPCSWLTLSLRSVAAAPALRNGARLRALFGTQEIDVRLRLLDRDALDAGEQCLAQVQCAASVVVPTSEHAVLRLPSPSLTVAGGKILESHTRRLRRNSPEVLQRLEDLRRLPVAEMLWSEVQRAGVAGISLSSLTQLSALSTQRVQALLEGRDFVVTRTGFVVQCSELDGLITRLQSLLSSQSTGLSLDQLRAALPAASIPVLNEALTRLLERGTIRERGKMFMIPRPGEELAQARDEAELTHQIASLLDRSGLTPPNPGTIVTSAATRRAVDRLLREGILVRAVDRAKGRELIFHRHAIDEARRRLAPLLTAPGLLVTEIAAALGISRKFCMPLLDHLDSIQFTRRVEDRRVRADTPVS